MRPVANESRLLTPDDLLRVRDNCTMELIDGRIVAKNGSVQSSEIEGNLAFIIHAFLLRQPIAHVFLTSLGYRCFGDDPDKIRKPDVTVVRNERMSALADPNPDYMPIVPDLAIEVIAPNDLVYEIGERVQEYLAAGFPLVWVADPKGRTVTVYPRVVRPLLFTEDDELTAESLLPGFRCKVADFFPATPVSLAAVVPANEP